MKNNKQILTITDAALNRVKFLMKKAGNDIVGIRVGIKTAGCSGLKYNIEYAILLLALDKSYTHTNI